MTKSKRFSLPSLPRPKGVSTLTLRAWEFTGTALVNLLIFSLLLVYLSPLSYLVITSFKTAEQMTDDTSPLLPAEKVSFTYQGEIYPVMQVPTAQGIRNLALVNRFRAYSEFLDPANPSAGLITWEGYWRSLKSVYCPVLTFANFRDRWQVIDFPLLITNTLLLALIGGVGVLFSSIAVAYGFSRFRIPGANLMFMLLIATIMIPDSITLLPNFFIYSRVLGWSGTWLPLLVPQFFGNALFIFLLRQNFKSIPREMDEAAMIDGANPLRILISIILPQSIPVVATVALLHFFYVWNEVRLSSLYLSVAQDLRLMSSTIQVISTFGFTPEKLQTTALMVMALPIIVLFMAQRFFMQDMVVTGLEK